MNMSWMEIPPEPAASYKAKAAKILDYLKKNPELPAESVKTWNVAVNQLNVLAKNGR
jgi:hypothetical protein